MSKEIFISGAERFPQINQFKDRIVAALEQEGITAYRSSLLSHPYTVEEHRKTVEDLFAALRRSHVIVVIVDNMGPSTIFEVGMAWALGKPIVTYTEGIMSEYEPGSPLDLLLRSTPQTHAIDELVRFVNK